MKKKQIHPLALIISGFTLAQALLLLVNPEGSDVYYYAVYHYENQCLIYFLLLGFPLLTGLSIYFHFRHQNVHTAIRAGLIAVTALQLVFFLSALFLNHQYWGYFIKRPVVFDEIREAKEVRNISFVSNETDSGRVKLFAKEDPYKNSRNLTSRSELYDDLFNRPFIILEEMSRVGKIWKGGLAAYEDTSQKIHPNDLRRIDSLIYSSGMIVYGSDGYDSSGVVYGFVIEFSIDNEPALVFAGLKGGHVANDHYPYFEFLFQKTDEGYALIKKQRFYTDIAGIEGIEYANVAPSFSLFILIIGGIMSVIVWIISQWKARMNDSTDRVQ